VSKTKPNLRPLLIKWALRMLCVSVVKFCYFNALVAFGQPLGALTQVLIQTAEGQSQDRERVGLNADDNETVSKKLARLDELSRSLVHEGNRILKDQQRFTLTMERGVRPLELACGKSVVGSPENKRHGLEIDPRSSDSQTREVSLNRSIVSTRKLAEAIQSEQKAICSKLIGIRGKTSDKCGELAVLSQLSTQLIRLINLREQQVVERSRLFETVSRLESQKCVSFGFSNDLSRRLLTYDILLDLNTTVLLDSFVQLASPGRSSLY